MAWRVWYDKVIINAAEILKVLALIWNAGALSLTEFKSGVHIADATVLNPKWY